MQGLTSENGLDKWQYLQDQKIENNWTAFTYKYQYIN